MLKNLNDSKVYSKNEPSHSFEKDDEANKEAEEESLLNEFNKVSFIKGKPEKNIRMFVIFIWFALVFIGVFEFYKQIEKIDDLNQQLINYKNLNETTKNKLEFLRAELSKKKQEKYQLMNELEEVHLKVKKMSIETIELKKAFSEKVLETEDLKAVQITKFDKENLDNSDLNREMVPNETNELPPCDVVVGKKGPNRQGWYSLIGGVICGIGIALDKNLTFTVDLSRTVYTGTSNLINAFELPYKRVGNCRRTKDTERLNLGGWNCPVPRPRSEMHDIIVKYVVPNDKVQKLIDDFVDNNFGKHTLGIHIRASDRANDKNLLAIGVRKVPSARITKAIERYLEANPQTDKIFVASDNVEQLTYLERKFPKLIISRNVHRSKNNKRIHTKKDGREKITEVIVDARLLARTKYLIKCFSEVSLASLIMNDKLDMDLLNVPDRIVFPESRAKIAGFNENKYVKLEDKYIK